MMKFWVRNSRLVPMGFSVRTASFILLFVGFLAGFLACTERLDFASELNEGELFQFVLTDTFDLECTTERQDSLRVYSNTNIQQSFLVGILDDPIFGTSEARFNVQLGITEFRNNRDPRLFEQASLDSVVLYLRWFENSFYGALGQGIGYEVRELMENLDSEEDYYAGYKAQVGSDLLASTLLNTPDPARRVPLPTDFIQTATGTNVMTDSVQNVLAIRLEDDFGRRIMDLDTSAFENSEVFRDFIPGIQVAPTPNSNGMVGIAILDQLNVECALFYSYTDDEGIFRQDVYSLQSQSCSQSSSYSPSCVRFTEMEHDYSNSIVQASFGDSIFGDSLLFLQGMIGTGIEISLPDIELGQSAGINQATLILPVIELDNDNNEDYPVAPIILPVYEEDGELEFLRDFGSQGVVDGLLREDPDTELLSYEINLPSHMQGILDGDFPPEIQIIAVSRARQANRVVLGGPKNEDRKTTLRIAYTQL